MQLRHLRGRVATELEPLHDPPDPIQQVRRAALLIDSDIPPDPGLLINAAEAAQQLMDPIVAERFARRAVEVGGGRAAQWIHMGALANCDRLSEALAVNTELIETASTDQDRVLQILSRVAILTRNWVTSDAAPQLEAIRRLADETGLRRPYNCLFAWVEAVRDRAQEAVDAASAGLTESGWLPEFYEPAGVLALVAGCRDLGTLDVIGQHADRGYELARTGLATPTTRFGLGLIHIEGLRLGGLLAEATELADRLAGEPMDLPFALTHRALYLGTTAMARGDLASASHRFREAMATAATLETTWLRTSGQFLLAVVLAMLGDRDAAVAILREENQDDGLDRYTQHISLAEAWVRAASGVMSEAITLVHDSTAQARTAGCPAREVWCLQTAAQFGDPSGAARLAELTAIVQGPRVAAAAAHAAALRDGDGAGLLDAAKRYEAFGDRIAAADAAAQAAVIHRANGRRGAGLTATAIARRLAAETGADTPALRADAVPIPLTGRQREIIVLAATGLSNREIADRLVMSVRTVEGHLFRASQKTGVNSREELIALLESGPVARP